MVTFNHFNFNVLDLEKSLAFYKEALGLEPVRRKEAEGRILSAGLSGGTGSLILPWSWTWLKDRTEAYDLGECEFHLAFRADNYEEMFRKHQEMGCVVFVNEAMGIYFITDPDGYWIEIIP